MAGVVSLLGQPGELIEMAPLKALMQERIWVAIKSASLSLG